MQALYVRLDPTNYRLSANRAQFLVVKKLVEQTFGIRMVRLVLGLSIPSLP